MIIYINMNEKTKYQSNCGYSIFILSLSIPSLFPFFFSNVGMLSQLEIVLLDVSPSTRDCWYIVSISMFCFFKKQVKLICLLLTYLQFYSSSYILLIFFYKCAFLFSKWAIFFFNNSISFYSSSFFEHSFLYDDLRNGCRIFAILLNIQQSDDDCPFIVAKSRINSLTSILYVSMQLKEISKDNLRNQLIFFNMYFTSSLNFKLSLFVLGFDRQEEFMKTVFIFKNIIHSSLLNYFMDNKDNIGFEVDQVGYFENLKKNIRVKKPQQQISEVQSLIQDELDHGKLEIKQNPETFTAIKKITKQIHRKSADFNKQLLKLSLKAKRGSQSIRGGSARSQVSYRSRGFLQAEITQDHIKQYRLKQLKASKRLKRLIEEKEESKKKKIQTEKKKQLKKLKEQAKQLKMEEEVLKQKQRFRTQQIQNKIKQIEKRKEERFQRLKNSRIKSTPTLPKYLMMKQKFETEQAEYKEIKMLKYKNSTKQKQLANNPIKVKEHEQKYQIRMGRKILQRSRISTEQQRKNLEANFNLLGRNEFEIKKKREKIDKMNDFEKNVSQRIRIKTNIQKQIELQIAKDKIVNPKKYHFLGQKSLNDYVIYRQFDQFGVNIDKKELGNKYLDELKAQVKVSRVKTNPVEPIYYQKQYKNYLGDARKNIKQQTEMSQIDKILQKYGNKSQAIEMLQEKSQQHSSKALEKIKKLKLIESYENSIKTEGQIDDEYISSIKARLACLQIQ